MAQLNDSETGETIVIRVDRDLEDLIPGFINNRRKDAESIADALKRKDYETIRVLGHGMKGAGGGTDSTPSPTSAKSSNRQPGTKMQEKYRSR